MDIRMYFQKVRAVEESISEPFVVVISEQTGDGGRAGVLAEVLRSAAARLVVDGRARLATQQEAEAFRSEQERARAAFEQASVAGRVQIAVLSDQELKSLKANLRQKG